MGYRVASKRIQSGAVRRGWDKGTEEWCHVLQLRKLFCCAVQLRLTAYVVLPRREYRRVALKSYRSLQIASCSFRFLPAEDVSATAQGSMLAWRGAL